MRPEVLILKRARQEIVAAWNWYEDKQPGLGDRFLNSLEKQLHQLELFPESCPQRKRPYREASLTDFPYLVIYRYEKRKQLILVVACFHAYLDPGKKPK